MRKGFLPAAEDRREKSPSPQQPQVCWLSGGEQRTKRSREKVALVVSRGRNHVRLRMIQAMARDGNLRTDILGFEDGADVPVLEGASMDAVLRETSLSSPDGKLGVSGVAAPACLSSVGSDVVGGLV